MFFMKISVRILFSMVYIGGGDLMATIVWPEGDGCEEKGIGYVIMDVTNM